MLGLDKANPQEFGNLVFLCLLHREEESGGEGEADLFFTWPLSSTDAGLHLDVSNNNGYDLPCLLNVKY